MNNRTFLDIDDTILTKNLILPVSDNNNQTYFMLKLVYNIYFLFSQENKSINDKLKPDSKPFFIIQPIPGNSY